MSTLDLALWIADHKTLCTAGYIAWVGGVLWWLHQGIK